MTRPQTQTSYATRLDRVADYTDEHLDEDVRPEHLAEVACLSPYHWHRIYMGMRGETISATMRRLRLLRAADRLANSDMPLRTIGERAGYSSGDAFARAFKEAYGKTPASYRATGSQAAFRAATDAKDADGFPVVLETPSPVRCASVAHKGSYMQIDQAMGRLFTELAAQEIITSDQKMIATFFDDPDLTPVEELRSRACSPVTDDVALGPPLDEAILRGGLYARLRYKGPYADMKGAYPWLLGVWLPQSAYEPDDAPVFEANLNSPQHAPLPELLTDIHLPLKMP